MKVRFHFVKRENDTIFNHLTKWATSSDKTHVFCSWVDRNTKMQLTYQVNGKGAYIKEYHSFMKDHGRQNICVLQVDFDSVQTESFLKRVYSLCFDQDVDYDIKGAIGIGIFRKFGLKIHKLFDGDSSFSCAEAQLDAYEHAKKINLGQEGLFGPESLYQLLKKQSGVSDVSRSFSSNR